MPGSRGHWARLASAGHGSRWPRLDRARTLVLPRRRSGAICQGSGAGLQSKHLAGFPQPRPGPASQSAARAPIGRRRPIISGKSGCCRASGEGEVQGGCSSPPPPPPPARLLSTPTPALPRDRLSRKANAPGPQLLPSPHSPSLLAPEAGSSPFSWGCRRLSAERR